MLSEQKAREDALHAIGIFNTRDMNRIASLIDELFTLNFVYHYPGVAHPVVGREGFTEFMRGLYHEIPDLYQNAPDDLIVQGDKVALRYSVSRTDPASGKRQTSMILNIQHYSGDQIEEMWELVGPWQAEA